MNIEARLEKLPVDRMRDAEEIFLTSTAGGIVPVKSVDGKIIGDGSVGLVTQRLTKMYWQLHEDDAYTTPVDYDQ